jgi:antitoxin component of MazEF toxin-antitoxin module
MPHEETRKIIRVGNSYAVTIPRPWLRYFKLTDKDEVTVISNGIIEIKPQLEKETVKVEQ